MIFGVRPRRRPLVFLGGVDDICPHRVLLDVPAEPVQVQLLLDDDAFVPALPDGAVSIVMVPVPAFAILRTEAADEARQCGGIEHLDGQVEMIAHDAVVIDVHPVCLSLSTEQFEEAVALLGGIQNPAAVEAAIEHVVYPCAHSAS